MKQKSRGRPPKKRVCSVRMTRATQMQLKYLARNTGWTQGHVLEIALRRLYDDVPTQ